MRLRLTTLAALGALLTLVAVVGVAAQPSGGATASRVPAEDVLDHFICYSAVGGFPGVHDVTLTDQFETAFTATIEAFQFCNPGTKTVAGGPPGEPPRFPFAHLACQFITELPGAPRVVQTEDQFGTNTLTVVRPMTLCLPTAKVAVDDVPEPPGPGFREAEAVLDHFKCYAVAGGQTVPPPLLLSDQFGTSDAIPGPGPDELCNPVSKATTTETGLPILHPEAHLTCYPLTPVSFGNMRSILVENQFGRYQLGAVARWRLCTPAMKHEAVLSHFKCYRVRAETKQEEVSLSDQFGDEKVVVTRPETLCNPVTKIRASGEVTPVADAQQHLKCYDITSTAAFERRAVEVTNQFGTQRLDVVRPETLCAPASKSLTGEPGPPPALLDHFKCYGVRGAPLNEPVTLRDAEFGTSEDDVVITPVQLCNPVTKVHGGVTFPARFPFHLTCYLLRAPEAFTQRTVNVNDQFGLEKTTVLRPVTLCVPSQKRLL